MHPTALIIRTRTQARQLGPLDPRAMRLSRLAEQLESILEARRRLQGSLEKQGELA
jgi:hypothetical protein